MFWRQLSLLLWKNFILRKRHWLRTLLEVIWPLFLFAILIAIRKTQPVETKQECHYPARAMPSAGVYPWFKSILCDIQNPCFNTMVPSETPGQVNDPLTNNSNIITSFTALFTLLNQNTSIVSNASQIINDLQALQNLTQQVFNETSGTVPLSSVVTDEVAYRNFLFVNLSLSSEVVDSLLSANVSFAQALGISAILGQRVLVCNETSLSTFLTLPSSPSSPANVSAELCALSDAQLSELSQYTNSSITLATINTAFEAGTVNAADYITIANRLAGYVQELQGIQGQVMDITNSLQSLNSLSDFNSSTFFNDFCGHPVVKNTGFSSFFSGSSSVDTNSSSLDLTQLLNYASYNSSYFCTNLIGTLEGNSEFTFFWDTVKPLLLGKIPYSPNTPLVRDIIQYANSTFETLALVQSFGENWDSNVGPTLYSALENGPLATQLRSLLSSSATLEPLANQLGVSLEQLEQLRTFLSNDDNPADSVTTWKDVYRLFNGGILLVTRIIGCVELDKFEGYDHEYELVDHSITLVNNNSLWGSIVFENLSSAGSFLPPVVKYKIRQDSASVTRTTDVQRYFWRPDAEAGIGRVRYFVSGFVHLQDIIENAIIQASINSNDSTKSIYNLTLGKYLQQMPYPCYTSDSYWKPDANADASSDMLYYTGNFLFLQDIVERATIAKILSGFSTSTPPPVWNVNSYMGVYLQEFPYPCYTYDEFLEYLGSLLSLLMTLAWVYSVCIIIKSVVYEKEQRLKEVMKMMGLSNGVHWVAWFINAFVVMFCSILLLVLILKAGAVTPYSNAFLLILWLSCFAFATIMQCFLISCFFSRANLAAACGGIIYFVLYIPYNMAYAFEDEMTQSQKILACLLSTVAFGYGAGYISQYEMAGDGLQFSNWASSPDPSDQMNFLTSMIMMLVDGVIYMTLTWYIENVFPGTYGVPRPWYFFATRSYWCGTSSGSVTDDYLHEAATIGSGVKLEAEPAHFKLGVSIQKLRKVYGNGKVAVDDLSMNFYEGQITSFLGHNGAGKTTTMSMLTGLFTPTSGTARIYGQDIRNDMDQIRHQLGFCPQYNVLFGDLTVLEHLKLYSGLKCAAGGSKVDHEETEKIIVDVGLPHKKNEVSRHLSGGMKRKLSVAVAFVGNSKCVILDEPTAGVDPYARRAIWDLLLRYRSNRTILLSTHHMDEADLLGDRIAIISHGKLKCCGSSLFLKSCFGVGYYLTIVKDGDSNDESVKGPEKIKLEPEQNSLSSDDDDLILVTSSQETKLKIDDGWMKQVSDSNDELVRKPEDVKKANESDGFSSLMVKNNENLLHVDKGSDEGFDSDRSPSDRGSSSSPANSCHASSSSSLETVARQDTPLAQDIIKASQLPNLVYNAIPHARIQEENQREITFVLPYQAQANGSYSTLLSQLDDRGLKYGLTDTSLEEIFLNVAEQSKDEGKEEKTNCCFCIPRRRKMSVTPDDSSDAQVQFGLQRRSTMRSISSGLSEHSQSPLVGRENEGFDGEFKEDDFNENDADDGSQGKGSYKVSGDKLVWQQFRALFIKRFHNARRNRKGIVAQVIVPAVFIALALTFALIVPQINNYPALELQPWMYGDTNTFYSNDMPNSSLPDEVSNALLDSPSIGMRCVNNYSVLNYDDSMITCDNRMDTSTWTPHNVTEGHSQLLTSNETLECSCTDKKTRVLLAECVNGAGGEPTPRALTETSDWMYDMTGRNLSDWLVKTVDRFLQKRYGGLSMGETYHSAVSADQLQTLFQLFEANSNFTLTNSANITSNAVDFTESLARTENAKVWFDNNGYHAMPTWLNILNNAALRSLLPPDKNPLDYGIAAVNHPLNFTKSTVDLAALSQNIKDTLISISVIFALSFIPASFVLFLIEEKVTKSKHLQFVSGVNQLIYWIANFIWDMINYTIPIIIVLFIFLAFQTKAYVSADNFPCLLCLLLLYGFAITPMMYPASFYFEVPSTAYVVLTCVNLFIGINASIATFIMEVLDDDNLKYINENYLKPAFLVFPQYCLGRGLLDMSINQAYADAYAAFGIDSFTPPFSFDLVGRNLMALAIEGTFFFILTILIQYRFFIPPQSSVHDINSLTLSASSSQDDDVLEERSRILNGDACDILQIKDLTKVYSKPGSGKDLVAVNRLCVGVPEGECFGLLGVNGAGKTTTFKMLTGDVIPTAGDSLICGQSILEDMREVQQNTGYCPQFEALCSLLTGREHLIFYAKLRGVPPEEVDGVADWAINKFGLKMYADKPAGTYSGGNKRKLSAAIAFIGCPPIVFLDEPTAGMDPMARRFLWGRIAEAVKGGRCIVLTSHSMEECEALCTRLAIMVNGQLQCLGSPQHLKNRYGEGYMLTVKVGGMNPDLSKVETFVKSISNAVLKESHCNTIMFQVPLQRIRLSELFRLMEENKEELHIEDYSISQTTLDEVFVSFAKNQTDGLEDEYGIQPPSYVSTNNVDYDVPYNEEIGDVENGQLSDADGIIMQNFKSTYAPTASTDQLLV